MKIFLQQTLRNKVYIMKISQAIPLRIFVAMKGSAPLTLFRFIDNNNILVDG